VFVQSSGSAVRDTGRKSQSSRKLVGSRSTRQRLIAVRSRSSRIGKRTGRWRKKFRTRASTSPASMAGMATPAPSRAARASSEAISSMQGTHQVAKEWMTGRPRSSAISMAPPSSRSSTSDSGSSPDQDNRFSAVALEAAKQGTSPASARRKRLRCRSGR
jgi:hypothetical protein